MLYILRAAWFYVLAGQRHVPSNSKDTKKTLEKYAIYEYIQMSLLLTLSRYLPTGKCQYSVILVLK